MDMSKTYFRIFLTNLNSELGTNQHELCQSEGIRERCRKTLIVEEFSSHVCVPDITGMREIMIDDTYETATKDGDRKIVAFGLDGVESTSSFYADITPFTNQRIRTFDSSRRELTRTRADEELRTISSLAERRCNSQHGRA